MVDADLNDVRNFAAPCVKFNNRPLIIKFYVETNIINQYSLVFPNNATFHFETHQNHCFFNYSECYDLDSKHCW